MQKPELYLVFVEPLNELQIQYMVTGSMAAMIYGEPRLTHDIDVVVDLQSSQILPFHGFFDNKDFYVPPVEVLKIEAARPMRGHFNLLHQKTGFKADVYLKGKDKLHEWAFEKRNEEIINGKQLWLAPPEYVIVRKLMYYKEGRSEKHLRDIQNILAQNETEADKEVLDQLIQEYNLGKTWQLVD